MKSISKKILAVLLAAICAFSVLAVNASAFFDDEDFFPEDIFSDLILEDNIYYEIYAEEDCYSASVIDFEVNEEGASLVPETVIIPETVEYEGENVTVTGIGYGAFMDCYTIREVTLPDTITSIDDQAFYAASHLEKIIVPETIDFEYFGFSVFEATPVLGYLAEQSTDSAVILGQNVLLAYLGNDKMYTIPEEIDFIADYCFFMAGIENVIFNESIELLPPYAFASCRNLKEITIPDSIYGIGEGAFSNCTNLEKINLGNSLKYIGTKAFENTKIKDIYLGDSIINVASAFAGCATLENITVSENNTSYFFENNALYYIFTDMDGNFESSVLEYFLVTADVTTFTVPEDVISVGPYAFYGCKQLDKVTINSYVDIYEFAFAYCDFERFDFANVGSVGYATFRGCNNLTSLDLSTVDYIDDSAFENCKNLANVTFSPSVYCIGARSFANTALEEVSISGDEAEIYEGAFADCKNLKSVDFNEGVAVIYSHVVANCPDLERVFISKTVNYIDYYAFEDCQNVNFQIIKYSDGADIIVEYADDADNDVTKYEFVGKLNIFERIAKFFSDLFEKIYDFFFRW